MAVLPGRGYNLQALAQALHQDYMDAKAKGARLSLSINCFPPESRFEFGLRSELTLLERACDKKASTVKQLSRCWATLVHAYIACPTAFEEQIKSGTMRLPNLPESEDGLKPAEAVVVSVIQVLATQLRTLGSSSTCPGLQKIPTYADFETLLHTLHLPLCTTILCTLHDLKSFKDLATEIGLSYQDVEWFSRAVMLRIVMQVAVKQGDMEDAVATQAVRHAHRLIQLLPDNPASYEFRSYAAMHSPAPESDLACRHMQKAICSASQSGDDVGVAQYAMQVVYFMLWNFSMSQDRLRDVDALECDLEELLAIFGSAEAFSGSGSSLSEGLSPSCWRNIAAARLLMATATVAKLAFAIPECPEQLLVCLQHALAKGASSRSKDVKPQYDRHYDISKDVKAGCFVGSRSKATSKHGQCRKAEAQQRRGIKASLQDMAIGKERLSGHDNNLKFNVPTSTGQTSKNNIIDSTGFGTAQASSSTRTAVCANKTNTITFEGRQQTSQASKGCTLPGLKAKARPELRHKSAAQPGQ